MIKPWETCAHNGSITFEIFTWVIHPIGLRYGKGFKGSSARVMSPICLSPIQYKKGYVAATLREFIVEGLKLTHITQHSNIYQEGDTSTKFSESRAI